AAGSAAQPRAAQPRAPQAPAQDSSAGSSRGASLARPSAEPAEPERGRVVGAVQELADWVRGRGGTLSARVVDSDSGAVWAEFGAQSALNPASNMKVITTAVALERLGSEYRFSTGLYGKQEGDRVDPLVLRGQGDPSLATEDLWQLARALRSLGVSKVGQILVDQSRFDDQFVPPAFEQQPEEWASFRAPVSAVALERNAVTLNVLPGEAGQPARVWFEPPGIVSIEGSVETRRPGSGEGVQLSLQTRGSELVAQLGGYAAKGLGRLRYERRLDDPRRAPGLALRELLSASGIQVQGAVALGGKQDEPRLAFHESQPLGQLVSQMGKYSDNFYAEMLFKALGAEATGGPARSEDGARVVLQWLSQHGLLGPDTRIQNGSGLFDANRVSATTLSGTLLAVRRNPAVYPEFLAQLAIGGVDGTLHSRFRKFRQQRIVRAKTGTLAATVALSGYVLGPGDSSAIIFSLLVNGLEGQAGAVREHIDRVVETIAEARLNTAAGTAPAH
ncbi:MAG TPA: D-alanyl-D-alanine carboxypeptidase/D-alanyl-D-alanine-endopeptidase, partial [Polyangiaceae bacterium]|nr:D-alanyl-D-alanine carboxypeptidase/D-alanyl-D-alanine-endopeptidase [Polyangiaceae bacterium]